MVVNVIRKVVTMLRLNTPLKFKTVFFLLIFCYIKPLLGATQEEKEGQRFSHFSSSEMADIDDLAPHMPSGMFVSSTILDPIWREARRRLILKLNTPEIFPSAIIFRQIGGRSTDPQRAFESFLRSECCITFITKENLKLAISYIEEDFVHRQEWLNSLVAKEFRPEIIKGHITIIDKLIEFSNENKEFFNFLKKRSGAEEVFPP